MALGIFVLRTGYIVGMAAWASPALPASLPAGREARGQSDSGAEEVAGQEEAGIGTRTSALSPWSDYVGTAASAVQRAKPGGNGVRAGEKNGEPKGSPK